MIFDREFYFYTSEESEWESSIATIEELFDAHQHRAISSDTWLWHISPELTEGEGVIHRIGAKAFTCAS